MSKSKDQEKNSSRGVTEKNNIFKGMPKKGTVIATVTAEELDTFQSVDEQVVALDANPRAFDKQETYDITKNRRDWWIEVAKAHNINYAWPIAINYMTGEIYINSDK